MSSNPKLEPSRLTAWSDQAIHILMSSDNGYAKPMMVSLFSLIEHLGAHRELVVHLFDFGIHPDNTRKILEIADKPNVAVDWHHQTNTDWMPTAALEAGISPSMCSRMISASLLPNVDRMLYIDCDIVVQADVGELWDMPRDNCPVWAVRDQVFPWIKGCYWLDHAAMGMDESAAYFNSGIMVVDLGLWRKEGVEAQLMSFYHKHHAQLIAPDQDTLNAVMTHRWRELPAGWNRLPWLENAFHHEELGLSRKDFESARAHPKIIHYAAFSKPWDTGLVSPMTEPFFNTVSKLDLGSWGKPKGPTPLCDLAWSINLTLTRRLGLARLGILSPSRFILGSLAGMARHPLLSALGLLLISRRKTLQLGRSLCR